MRWLIVSGIVGMVSLFSFSCKKEKQLKEETRRSVLIKGSWKLKSIGQDTANLRVLDAGETAPAVYGITMIFSDSSSGKKIEEYSAGGFISKDTSIFSWYLSQDSSQIFVKYPNTIKPVMDSIYKLSATELITLDNNAGQGSAYNFWKVFQKQ